MFTQKAPMDTYSGIRTWPTLRSTMVQTKDSPRKK